jgi:hypothetical protein
VTCIQIRQIETLPIVKKQLPTETRNDPELSEIYNSLISGITKPKIHQKFSLHHGCLMNGIRVVIPKLLQKQVLHEPHTTTKRSPAELMFGRKIRSRLKIMRSNIQQEMNLNDFETPKKTNSYVPEQPVQIRFYDGPCKKFGTVVCQKSQLNYVVLVDGTEHIRHV